MQQRKTQYERYQNPVDADSNVERIIKVTNASYQARPNPTPRHATPQHTVPQQTTSQQARAQRSVKQRTRKKPAPGQMKTGRKTTTRQRGSQYARIFGNAANDDQEIPVIDADLFDRPPGLVERFAFIKASWVMRIFIVAAITVCVFYLYPGTFTSVKSGVKSGVQQVTEKLRKVRKGAQIQAPHLDVINGRPGDNGDEPYISDDTAGRAGVGDQRDLEEALKAVAAEIADADAAQALYDIQDYTVAQEPDLPAVESPVRSDRIEQATVDSDAKDSLRNVLQPNEHEPHLSDIVVPELPTRGELRRLVSRFVWAYETGDIEMLQALMANDVVFSNGNGMQGIREDYLNLFASSSERKLMIRNMRWTLGKGYAKGVGDMRATVVDTNKDTSVMQGRIQFVVQQKDNKSVITHLYHLEHPG